MTFLSYFPPKHCFYNNISWNGLKIRTLNVKVGVLNGFPCEFSRKEDLLFYTYNFICYPEVPNVGFLTLVNPLNFSLPPRASMDWIIRVRSFASNVKVS